MGSLLLHESYGHFVQLISYLISNSILNHLFEAISKYQSLLHRDPNDQVNKVSWLPSSIMVKYILIYIGKYCCLRKLDLNIIIAQFFYQCSKCERRCLCLGILVTDESTTSIKAGGRDGENLDPMAYAILGAPACQQRCSRWWRTVSSCWCRCCICWVNSLLIASTTAPMEVHMGGTWHLPSNVPELALWVSEALKFGLFSWQAL